MIVVRRTLTELLLETTNEEISKVAEETVKSFKSKGNYLYISSKTFDGFSNSQLIVQV